MLALSAVSSAGPSVVRAQEVPETIELTLDEAVERTVAESYEVEQLRLRIDQRRLYLQAELAEMKTSVDLELAAPIFEQVSEYQYNSVLGRNEIVRENSRLWEVDVSVRQPVILFGYTTNGYLSLNSEVSRYTQIEDGESFTRYYNRYFVAYEQPLFQPNEQENELKEARFDLEEAGMDFRESAIDIINDVAESYFELVELAYEREIHRNLAANLERALAIAAADPARATDVTQLQVELANAREQAQQSQSSFWLEASDMKRQLRLDPSDSLVIRPVLSVRPVSVDLERAMSYANELVPTLRYLEIQKWNERVELERTRAENSFNLDLELTYGREMDDPRFGRLWTEPRNSYTISLQADMPIWDWGAGDARVEAARLELEQTDLRVEQVREQVRTGVENAVRNLEAYQRRALDMQRNLDLARGIAESSLARYAAGEIDLTSLLRSLDRQAETARNFLETYLGYRRGLLELQELTHFDFEKKVPVLERFDLEIGEGAERPRGG